MPARVDGSTRHRPELPPANVTSSGCICEVSAPVRPAVGLPIAGAGASIQFDTFFQERHEQLFKALYFVTGDHRDAEELMQDAFLKLWER
jgi:hypothetical protein